MGAKAYFDVEVVGIVRNWDMRSVHKLRNIPKAKRLKFSECILAFNRRQTMARIIDHAGGVHTYYASKNEIFDLDAISNLMKSIFYVRLEVGRKTVDQQVSKLMEAA